MEENNNLENNYLESKKIAKKQIIKMSVGVGLLIVLVIGAAYAFFIFGSSNLFGTSKLTAKTPDSNNGSVILENINNELSLVIEANDMTHARGNTTYWASPEGKKTTETVNQIGRARALLDGTYTCNYTMTVEDKSSSEKSLYNAFQSMSEKSNNQIVLQVNEKTYDFNTSNLFPITYSSTMNGITQSNHQYITSSMYLKNELNIDQTDLSNKEVELEFKVTELNCRDNNDLPSITRFAIGDNSDEGIAYGNNQTIYIEWNNNSIEKYCITNTNDVSTCSWVNTTSNNGEEVNYTITGNIGDTITLYSYIKDNEGFISEVASKEVTIAQKTYPLTITKGPGVTQICTKINGATNYTCETPVGDSITKEVNENSTYSYYGVTTNNSLFDNCYDNNTHSCSGTMDSRKEHGVGPNMSKYVISISDDTGSNGVITQSQPTTVQTGSNATTDYRYIGADPNNYVCLGNLKNDGKCEDYDYLYRIIGVIPTQTTKSGGYENRIKLMKYRSYLDSDKLNSNDTNRGYGYYWTGQKESGQSKYTSYTGAESNMNNWEESTLNRVILNQTFYNSLEEKYQNMIGNSVWYLGGSEDSQVPTSTMYTAERSETTLSYRNNPKYAERKIGLMYPSDFGYATSGGNTTNRTTCLTTDLYSWKNSEFDDCGGWFGNWIKDSEMKWTITPASDTYTDVFYLYDNYIYIVNYGENVYRMVYGVYPNFYLNANVKVISGSGSSNSPYIIGQ